MPTAGAASNVSLTFGYTAANQLQSRASSNSVYDWINFTAGTTNKTADGLNRDSTITALSDGYDHNGSVTDDGTRRLTYDYENRITGATMIATSAVTSLAYDPLGRLQQQQTTPSGGSAATTQFLYDGNRLSAEYDGSGNVLRRYVHGPGTDEPIVWYVGSSTSDRRSLYADERGSIIAYATAAGVVTTYAYGPYGEPAAWSGSRFSYTGQIMIPEIALYHYKARAYDPAAGRFMQTDPIGYEGGQNLYAYVGGDPVNLADPLGQSSGPNSANQSLAYATVSGPIYGDSGAFRTQIIWGLATPSLSGGYIVQEITINYTYQNPGDATPYTTPIHYWEAWHVSAGSQMTDLQAQNLSSYDDQFSYNGSSAAQGSFSMTGNARFYENLTLPATFAVGNVIYAGSLPATFSDPSTDLLQNSNASNVVTRNINTRWTAPPPQRAP